MKDKVSHNAIKKKMSLCFQLLKYVDTHNTMLNVTTRLAVSIRNIPPWDFEWNDTTPQKHRRDLTVDDLLPNEEDGQALFEKAVLHTMQVITENFPSIGSLKKFLPSPEITCPHKSVVVPQKVLFRDEKYTDENIQILRQYIKDCKFTGNPQVQCGNFKNV